MVVFVNEQKIKEPCPQTHEPLDYSHFEELTENVRSWNWDVDPNMMLGECRGCGTSISYPKGPSDSPAKPLCFVPHSGLKHDVAAEMDRIQSRAVEHMTDAHTDGAVTIDEVGS